MINSNFTQCLLQWHVKKNKRTMPWKGEKDPYKIWVSEIILQQTRVEQGLSYYNNFISRFPTVKSLALAPEEAVFKLWEGLGYYSRCRNLIATAKFINSSLDNRFPTSYGEIRSLKGIGPYTAAAISSFAYGLPHAVVDGNVARVLARYFGKAVAIDTTQGRKFFTDLAHQLLDKSDTAEYNQAIMDFGATVCKPQLPLCEECPFRKDCIAYNTGIVSELPVKEKKLTKRKRWFYYFVFQAGNEILVRKRTAGDIWQDLHEFHLVEADRRVSGAEKSIKKLLHEHIGIIDYDLIYTSAVYTQQLTHQSLEGRFIRVELEKFPEHLKGYTRTRMEDLKIKAFPKFINSYINDHLLPIT